MTRHIETHCNVDIPPKPNPPCEHAWMSQSSGGTTVETVAIVILSVRENRTGELQSNLCFLDKVDKWRRARAHTNLS